MEWLALGILFSSGLLAGVVNTIVGSGSLITFPVLIALGYPPVLANVTNNVGVLPGSMSGAFAYRKELKGHYRLLLVTAAFSFIGGVLGAIFLLLAPAAVFDAIVPILILVACILVLIAPRIKLLVARWQLRHNEGGQKSKVPMAMTAGLTGVYGGYFGAAQGVILLSLLSIQMDGGLQRANAYKNVLTAVANSAAAVVFISTTEVAWGAAGAIALGAVLGGQIGGLIGTRLPPMLFRIIILAVGLVAIIYFYLK